MFKVVARLKAAALGASEHELLCQMLTLGGECGQLDLNKLETVESAFRLPQTIEFVYVDKVCESGSAPAATRP